MSDSLLAAVSRRVVDSAITKSMLVQDGTGISLDARALGLDVEQTWSEGNGAADDTMIGDGGTDYGALVQDGTETFLGSVGSGGLDWYAEAALQPWSEAEGSQKDDTFCRMIEDGNEVCVELMLKEGHSPNSSSEFDFNCMTALERAVLAATTTPGVSIMIALLNARADPMQNKFDGAIITPDVVLHGAEPDYLHGFPLPGFAGLFALLGHSHNDTSTWMWKDHVLRQYRVQDNWRRFRLGFTRRCIAIYWLGATAKALCAEGGLRREQDLADFLLLHKELEAA